MHAKDLHDDPLMSGIAFDESGPMPLATLWAFKELHRRLHMAPAYRCLSTP